MKHFSRAGRLVLTGAAAVLLTGCSRGPARANTATSGSVRSLEVFRPGPRDETVVSMDASSFQRRVASAVDDMGRWTLQLHGAAPTAQRSSQRAGRVLTFEQDEPGLIALVSLLDHDKKRITVFTPPLRLMPASLLGSAEYTGESSLEVFDVGAPNTVIERGSARSVSRLIDVVEGTVCVESVMNFEFSAASVEQGRRFMFASSGQSRVLIEDEEWLTVKVGILTLTRTRERWRVATDQ